MGVSKSAVLILVLATGLNICINLVESQRNGQFPFIFQNISLAADPSTTKFYTTTLEIGNKTDLSYNQTIFTNAVNSFYGGNTTGLYGFASVSNIESTDSPSGQTVVSYSVVYNYTTLYDGTGGKDSAIDKSIGNVTVVKNGIESDTMFNSLFFVNENSFVFNGEKLCGKLACSGNFVTCSEVLTGVTVECVSNCYSGI
uniref:SEA domain-containing protein n=1 Tax=Ciona savignyi TaxID=51511 RepID=H2YHE2_CIOSA